MDHEVSKRFDRIEEALKEHSKGLHDRISGLSEKLNAHLIADGPQKTAVQKDVDGLGERLNRHIEEHADRRKWTFGLWASIIILALKAAWDLISAKIGGAK